MNKNTNKTISHFDNSETALTKIVFFIIVLTIVLGSSLLSNHGHKQKGVTNCAKGKDSCSVCWLAANVVPMHLFDEDGTDLCGIPSMMDLVAFQISAAFVCVALVSLVSDRSDRAIYGTRLSEFIIERGRILNWKWLICGIASLSVSNLLCLTWRKQALIPLITLSAMLLVLLLIYQASKLCFGEELTRSKIKDSYIKFINGGYAYSDKISLIVENDIDRLYFRTQEYLNDHKLDSARQNLDLYVDMIVHLAESAVSGGQEEVKMSFRRQNLIKKLVMNYAFLVEECKSERIGQNDLVVLTCTDFLKKFFGADQVISASLDCADEALKATLGGYKSQILDNNYSLVFLDSFSFRVAHFLAQGDSHQDTGILESSNNLKALEYMHKYGSKYKYSSDSETLYFINLFDFSKEHSPVELIDYEGWTPLMEACEYGQLDIVKFLLSDKVCESEGKRKDSLNRVDRNGLRPLLIAEKNGRTNIVEYLLELEHGIA